jgi:hypothetical protein
MSTILLFLFFGFFVGAPIANAQDPFSSIKIGTTAFTELVGHPAFPDSELVVVQFCGPRGLCGNSEFYTKQLRDRGFDISFAAVYDSTRFGLSYQRFYHENKIILLWGHHWFKAAANQVYILDASRTVIYQGFMPDSEIGILSMIAEGTASYYDVQGLIDERGDSFRGVSPGLWYYQGRLLPLRFQLGRFVELNQLATTELSLENDVRFLGSVDYVPGKVMESLLRALDLSATVTMPTKEDEYIVVSIK